MTTKQKVSLKLIGINGKPMTLPKAVSHVEMVEVRKADAAIRLEYHQDRQRQAHALRKEFRYLGDDEMVFAMHWLAVAFQAVPSLAKWAATKTVDGRKPGPVQLKKLVFKWLLQPVCAASRGKVFGALTGAV